MVQNEPKLEEVLPNFLEFIRGSILVAHNADFDIGYLKQQCKKYGYSDFNPAFIDTLQMAKDLYPELKQFGLGPLNKNWACIWKIITGQWMTVKRPEICF